MQNSQLKAAMRMAEVGDIARVRAADRDEAVAIARATEEDWMARKDALDTEREDDQDGRRISVAGWSESTTEEQAVDWRLYITY